MQPGERLELGLQIVATRDCELLALDWTLLPGLTVTGGPPIAFPARLAAGQTLAALAAFQSQAGQELFGELGAVLRYRAAGGPDSTAAWSSWLSVFQRRVADDREPLSDDLRARLINVVNARDRNGQIFIAAPVAFFDDFLNVEVPPARQRLIAAEFRFQEEGLPLSPELYTSFILGEMSFYGIERLELQAEEDCPDEDDRFNAPDVREVNA
jgi:hypothetical protein